jgi:hypothetical protein
MLGEERSMPRGPHESRTDYVARLRRWRDAKSRLGNALELARQLSGYLRDGAGDSLRISVIGNGTVAGTPPVVTIETDGTEAYDQASATSWCGAEWDGDTDSWARFWIVIECDPRYTRATTLGIAGDRTARSFGSTMPVAVCDGIRSIVLQWKAAHAANLAVILTFGDSGPLVPSGWARLGDRSPMFCYFRGRE